MTSKPMPPTEPTPAPTRTTSVKAPQDDEPYMPAFLDEEEVESGAQKFWNKMKREPLVPLGALLTCGALGYATVQMRRGNQKHFQSALRWRIVFQTVTVIAAVAGLYYVRPPPGPPAKNPDGTTPPWPHWNQQKNEENEARRQAEWRDRPALARPRRRPPCARWWRRRSRRASAVRTPRGGASPRLSLSRVPRSRRSHRSALCRASARTSAASPSNVVTQHRRYTTDS